MLLLVVKVLFYRTWSCAPKVDAYNKENMFVCLPCAAARFRTFVIRTCHQWGEGGDSVKGNTGSRNIDTECGETQATIPIVCVQGFPII